MSDENSFSLGWRGDHNSQMLSELMCSGISDLGIEVFYDSLFITIISVPGLFIV